MTRVMRAEAERAVCENGWLAACPQRFRQELLDRAILQHFAPGDVMFRLDDPVGGIYGLASGTVSSNIAPPGYPPRRITLGIPGHWTGEGCFLTRKPRRGELSAIVNTSMFHVPLAALDQMASRDTEVVNHIAQILMMTVQTLVWVIHDLQKPNASRRIASVLRRASWVGDAPLRITQKELGDMANVSRKQVNATLKQFSEYGWVKHDFRSITVTDSQALRRFADSDVSV